MQNTMSGALRHQLKRCLLASCLLLVPALSIAQPAAGKAPTAVPVLMVSDIHFEPFWDPAKVQQLAAAPASLWASILAAPASSDQQLRFAALQKGCRAKGVDSSFPLLESSLHAMKTNAADAKFITLSGDLISHAFPCKFAAVFPHAAPGDYKAFVQKTVDFVLAELRATFPSVPLYAALGNNDSDCADYALDAHSDFLSTEGQSFAAKFPVPEQGHAQESFAAGGYYSVALPAPIQHGRLLVLDDLFMSARYTTCAKSPDLSAAAAQIAWLRDRLTMARRNKEKVWVMGHIPPGIDPYATASKLTDVCSGQPAVAFLNSDALEQTLSEYGDVVQLAIFAHTHMDELRLITPDKTADPSASQKSVALKMVPSISPVDGNNPAFTVASIDPATAVMMGYRVFESSDHLGTSWTQEYEYAKAYHQPSFSAAPVENLIAGFKADPKALSSASEAYLNNYFGKAGRMELKAFWPQYVCALQNLTTESYKNCVCTATPAAH